MTEEELKAIRERCEKATLGPWHMNGNRIVSGFYPGHIICTTSEIGSEEIDFPNAYFIALVRSDIPKLLDEIDRLKIQLKATTDIAEKYQPGVSKIVEYGLKRAKDDWNVYIGLPDAEDK